MPKAENEEISDDEFLLRRVPTSLFRNDDPTRIDLQAFRPVGGTNARLPDTDGISLYRESCLDRPEQILEGLTIEKQASTGIVRLSVGAIRDLGLTIDVQPTEAIPGHVVIREINADAVTNARAFLKRMQAELAAIASEPGNIVLRPEDV